MFEEKTLTVKMGKLKLSFVLLIVLTSQINSLGVNANIIESFLHDYLGPIIGQTPNNLHGSDPQYKEFALNDKSNEDIGRSTTQEIITRSGYKFENYYVVTEDGYVTQLIRLINPLADKKFLKQPPVMLLHGGIIDPTNFVWASAIQHHPEPYPRNEDSGIMTSFNRSIGFVLSNNGYDVWLVPTRGCNRQNMGHVKFVHPQSKLNLFNFKEDPQNLATPEAKEYWKFSFDDLIEHEVPKQIEKVLEVTQAQNVSLLSFSLSTMVTLPLFAKNEIVASKIHNHVVMAPIVSNKGSNRVIRLLHRLISALGDDFGTIIFTKLIFSQAFRDAVLLLSKSKLIRYSLVKAAITILTGSSAEYHTLLEAGVLGHIFMPLGFKEFKHYAQQVIASQFQKYDYGLVKNKMIYGSIKPPVYDFSKSLVQNWILISSEYDNLAPPASIKQVEMTIDPKPYKHIFYPRSSHLDLVAGFQNDIYVNLPILDYLDEFQLAPQKISEHDENNLDNIGLERFVPTPAISI